ncbi:protein FAM177B-like [Scyliorhinus torazame]|uniref:protein FAM177B-like n=1 Tax=Scyliorhinus torazame TaxID=75743 RepID=UPI003B5A9A6C
MEQDGESHKQTEAAEPKDTEAGKKEPKRRIHFSSGETMEEYSTEEEFEEEQKVLETVNPSTLPWSHFLLFWMMKFARTSLFTCDFLGEKLANLFGLTSAKYQYAVDEYYSVKDQEGYEDGDEMTVMEEVTMNEKQHLPIQNSQYGTLNMVEKPGVDSRADSKHTVSYDNEAVEDNEEIIDPIKVVSNQ